MNDLWNPQTNHSSTQGGANGNHAQPDFQLRLMLLEQQIRKRKMMMIVRQKQDLHGSVQVPAPAMSAACTPSVLQALSWQPPASPYDDLHGAHIPADSVLHAVPHVKLMFLDLHNKKRRKMMVTQKQDGRQPTPKGPTTRDQRNPLHASKPE